MRRYWYKTKRPNKISGKREMRVFTQYPHGYDVYLAEVIKKEISPDGKEHFIHTLYDRNTDRVVKVFDDAGNCGFPCSRETIEETLDPMLRSVNQLRRARKTSTKVKRKKSKKGRK